MKKILSHNHPFHMVTISPWPITTSLSLFITLIGCVKLSYENSFNLIINGMFPLMISLILWWRDVVRESTFQGCHTNIITMLLQMGMILFITSEIFFFLTFFWTFFHMSLSPSIELGNMWPPMGIKQFNPYNIPLLNTIILLSSGISITWSHYSILSKNFTKAYFSILMTIILGMYFTWLQFMEYNEANFTITDSVFGSTFFLITGFHGIHVMIGTMFIFITSMRLLKLQFSQIHHIGFEASSWYWHFVDVIWLFVYMFLYWWNY